MQTTYFKLKEFFPNCSAFNIMDVLGDLEKSNNLLQLWSLLNDIRTKFKYAIIISSGYRSPQHNKNVGGSHTSQHCLMSAVDIHFSSKCPYTLQSFLIWLRKYYLDSHKQANIGQVIYYPDKGIIHIALRSVTHSHYKEYLSKNNKYILIHEIL